MQTPGFPREAPVGCGHEGGGLFVSCEDELDRGLAQRLHDIEIFLTGNPEHPVHALVLERRDEQIRSFHR